MNNKNIKILGMLVAILVIIIFCVSTTGVGQKNKRIKIGLITPMTGQYAMFGEVNKNAAEMAREHFGSENIELLIEDDAYDPKKAVSAYQKLRSLNDVDAVIVLGAPSIQAIKPLTDKDNIPLLGLGVTLVYQKDSVFQLMPAGTAAFPKLGSIYSEKYDSIVVAHSNAELFTLNAQGFKQGMKKDTLIADVAIPPASDYQTEVSKIIKLNPKVVTVFFPLEDALKFLKTLRVLDPTGKIKVTCDFQTEISTKEYINAFGADRLEGCISTNLKSTGSEEFKTAYKQKYGIDILLTGDYTYDAVGMIKSLSEKYDRDDWVKALSSNGYAYTGVSGTIQFNDDGTRLDSTAVVREFRNGVFVEQL